jgi:subtilisin family serine protease
MRQKLFAFFAISLIICINLDAQKYFYSRNTKVLLSEDTTIVIIKGKQKASYNQIANLYRDKYIFFDTTALMDLALIKFKTPKAKYQSLNSIKSDTDILYTSNLLKGGNVPYIPTGEILLLPKEGTNISAVLSSLNLKAKIQSSRKAFDITVLKIVEGEDIFSIANKIYESGQAKWCHPNFFVPIQHFTNDPLYEQQFYLKNTGQGGGSPGIDINVESAWNITKGSSSIKIAVIDDGVEDHEDLSGRVLNGFTPRDQTSGNGRPTISDAHGVACAGIIAATQDNNIGIAGIAPNCMIVPINIFFGGETTLDLANAINWAWNQGQADILSNSWGYNTSSQTEIGFDAIIQAINNARTQGRNGKGSVVIFASGNGGTSVSFPANVQDVITVGAIQKNGNIWGYSCTGSEMDVVTVSGNVNLLGDITTTDRMGTLGYETGNYTNRFGGTSAACPQVAGVAALMLSVVPNLTEIQVRTILQNTATDMGSTGFDNTFGFGRVNASAAVCSALSTGVKINGDDIICNSSLYNIPNLPSNANITWSIPSSAGPVLQLAQNTPSINQLTITNQKWYGISTTLTATISGLGCSTNFTTVKSIVNDNSTSASIPYSYYQESCGFYNVSHPSQSGTIYSNSSPVFVHQGCMVYVPLGDMSGRTVNLQQGSGVPLYWGITGPTSYFPYSNQTLIFQLPYLSGGIPFTFEITGNGACFTRTLLFFSYSGNARYAFVASPNPAKENLTIVVSEDEKYLKENKLTSKKVELEFTMNVYDANTSTLQMTQRSGKGSMQHTLNVSRLKKGFYVLQINYEKESQSIKFFKE